jgi:hypothetical protein
VSDHGEKLPGVVKVEVMASLAPDDDGALTKEEAFAEALVAEALAPFGAMDADERALLEATLVTDLLFDPRFADWLKLAMLEAQPIDASDVFPREDASQRRALVDHVGAKVGAVKVGGAKVKVGAKVGSVASVKVRKKA